MLLPALTAGGIQRCACKVISHYIMSKFIQYAVLGVTHPTELRSLINWAVWRDPTQRIEELKESGYDRPTMKRCWEFLDLTSRSFAAVIKELEGELCRVICLFYLVLRGLDTVEDDMTLDLNLKCKLLEEFHLKLSEPGWTFTGSAYFLVPSNAFPSHHIMHESTILR